MHRRLSGLYILEESVGEALVRNVDRADLNIDRGDHAVLRGTRQYSAALCHRWYTLKADGLSPVHQSAVL